jgi:Tfp pilus assembly pilus retraction ATPase PilT
MQTMDMALRELVRYGAVTMETALKYTNDQENFSRLVNATGF